MQTVYDPQGKAHQRDPVDARECIDRLGWTAEPQGGAKAAAPDAPAAAPKRNMAELRGLLDQRNVPWTSADLKAVLEAKVADSEPA